jgi:hypothetical protein
MNAGRRLSIAWIALGAVWAAVAVQAQTPAPLAIRRVHAPADRMEQWPMAGHRYLPIDAAEFARLLDTARTSSSGPDANLAARLASAEYRARLDGEQLVEGQAEWVVETSAPRGGLLTLAGINLAMAQPAWITPQAGPAALGLAPGRAAALLVEKPGKLGFRWSLRGTADEEGAIQFQVQLPPCPANRLILDLPDNVACAPDRGLLSRAEPSGAGRVKWRVELGGQVRVRLSIAPPVGPRAASRVQARQTTVYDFSLHGVDVGVQLALEIPSQPLKKLTVALDPGLELVAARYGDRPLAWSILPVDGRQGNRVELGFPEPVQGSQTIRLSALAPLSTDQPWRLPRVRPQGVYWQQGAANLLLPQPLVLNRLVCDGWRQSGVGPLPAPRTGESLQMECFSPEGTAEVLLVRRPPRLQVTSGLSLDLGGDEIRARLVADLRVTDGEKFAVTADVEKNWIVTGVECTPADALEDWSSLEHRSEGRSRLSLTLQKALSPTRPLRLKVTARRLYAPPGRRLGLDELVPLRLAPAVDSQGVIGLSVAGPFDLRLAGTESLVQLDPRKLDSKQRELLGRVPRDMAFVDDANAAGLSVALERRRPGYTTAIAVEATLSGKVLEETYHLRCAPESASVERLLVYFSCRRDAPVRWSLAGQPGPALDARRWSPEEQAAAGLGPGEEAWELVLRRPTAEAFEIEGTRRSELGMQQGLALASLPESSTQQGSVVVRSIGPQDLRVKNQLLAPIPLSSNGSHKSPPVRASFRYEPERHVTGLATPALLVSFVERPSLSPTWVWDCLLQSRYHADGSGLHLAVYRLQNLGAARFRLVLPAEVREDQVRGVWIGQTPVSWHADGAPLNLCVDLPAERLLSIAVQFTTSATQLAWRGTLEPPLPHPDVPVLEQHWIAWLPPGYEPGTEASDSDTVWQRLFGPLARQARQSPWHPLAGPYLPVASTYRQSRAGAEQRAAQFLAALGKALSATGRDLTWEKVLAEAAPAAAVPVLIDRQGLSLAGLGRLPALRPATDSEPARRASATLANQQLTFLVHDQALVLTSQAAAAVQRRGLKPLEAWPLWWIEPGPLAEQITLAAAGRTTEGLMPLEAWSQAVLSQELPWHAPELDGSSPEDLYGWNACWAEIPAGKRLELPYVHRKRAQLVGWITWFALVGVVSLLIRRSAVLIALMAIVGGAALVVPASWAPLAAASLLALMVCLLLRWVRVPREPFVADDSTRSAELRSTTSAPAVGIMLAATLAAACSASAAEPASNKPAPPAPSRFDVFIPTDDQGKPAGDKYYVPEELFNQLHRQAAAADPARQWLIRKAEYQATLAWQAAPEGLTVERLKAVFHLWSFESRSRVRIPLARSAAELLESETTLDGRPARPQWDLDAGGVLVDIAGPGPSRVELVLRPTVKSTPAGAGFELAIPALAESSLDLLVPADAPRVEFPSALGAVSWSEETHRWRVELGPTSRLAVSWPGGVRRTSGGNKTDVEELLWLKIQPNAVLVDARFKYKVIEGQLRQMELVCDPRLRLLPLRTPGLTVTETVTPPGQPQVIRLELARPATDQFVFEGTLLLSGTTPAGNLRMPRLESAGVRRTKRWLAVSVDTALGYEEQVSEPLEAVSIPDFLAEWGGDTAPLLAYKFPVRTLWGIAVRPRRAQTVADQVLRLSYGPGGADVQFDAELNTAGGYCLQHRIAAPAGLQTERISLLDEGVERVTRWAADSDGSLWVFLASPVGGRHVLSLRGRLPTPARGQVALPQFQLLQAQIASSTIEIFRRPAVNLKIAAATGLIELQSPAAEMAKSERGRLVRAYVTDGKKRPSAMIQLSPNEPVVRAVETIVVDPSAGAWKAVAEFGLEVKQGTLERLEVEIPKATKSTYELDPPLPWRVVEQAGQMPQMLIEPAEPIHGVFRLRISCTLASSPSTPVRVPDIRLRSFPAAQRLIILPGKRVGTPLAWETIGLRPIELRPALAADELVAGLESPTAYRVQSEPFRAALRAQQVGSVGGEVRQAEIALALSADGQYQGVAAFDVIPGTLMECPLELPAATRLVQVYVAGQPVTPEPRGNNQWQVPFLLGRLPQRIEVLFVGNSEPGPARTALAAPRLGDLRVHQTVWRVFAPQGTRFAGEGEVSRLRAELVGLRTLRALAAFDRKAASPEPEELFCWHRWCAAQLARRRATLEAQLSEALWAGRDTGEPPAAIRSELKSAVEQVAQINTWLAANASLAPSAQDASFGPGLQFLWCETSGSGRTPLCVLGEGWLDQVNLEPAASLPSAWRKGLWTALVGLLAVVLVGLLQLEAVGRLLGRMAYLLAAVVGVFWWFVLWPGFVGLWIAVGSLALWCIARWRRGRAAPEAATISVHARSLHA